MEWLKAAPPGVIRCVSERNTRESMKLVRQLLRLGVKSLLPADIRASPNGLVESASKLVALLPADATTRSAVMEWNRRLVESNGFVPEPDDGGPYLLIWVG